VKKRRTEYVHLRTQSQLSAVNRKIPSLYNKMLSYSRETALQGAL